MNTNEKFEKLYADILSENTQSLEKSRNDAKIETIQKGTILTILIVIGIILFLVIFICYYPNVSVLGSILPVYIMMAISVYFVMILMGKNSKVSKYKKEFKEKIITALIDSFDENLKYLPTRGIGSNGYDNAEFEDYDRFNSEDLIRGALKNNCNFEMAEVLTEHEHSRINEEGEEYTLYYSPIFHGIFAKMETPKTFNARLYLRKDRKDKNILGRVLTKKLPFDNLKVDLDSPEFEKYFDVYCTDKIIALQLLTSDIMQLLVNFQNEMGMDYELTIKDNRIYIRFMSGKMFETAGVNKFSLDKDTLYKYYRMLDFSFTLSDKLINLIKNTEYDLGGD